MYDGKSTVYCNYTNSSMAIKLAKIRFVAKTSYQIMGDGNKIKEIS